jgi:hypothetical protein
MVPSTTQRNAEALKTLENVACIKSRKFWKYSGHAIVNV